MPFEAFDKKIEEAAAHHHPVYDEQAWNKMKLLLDKHLPEKKEKKRRFFWIWFLLFLLAAGGGSVWMISDHRNANEQKELAGNNSSTNKDHTADKNDIRSIAIDQGAVNEALNKNGNTSSKETSAGKNNNSSDIIKETEQKSSANNNENEISLNDAANNKTSNSITVRSDKKASGINASSDNNKATKITTSVAVSKRTSFRSKNRKSVDPSDDIVSSPKKKAKNRGRSSSAKISRSADIAASDKTLNYAKQGDAEVNNDIAANDMKKEEKNEAVMKDNDEANNNIENKTSKPATNKADSASTGSKDVIAKTDTKLPRKKKSFSNSFGISVSAGPDVSAVGLSQVGSTRIVYGAGLSYQFAKKWNIRTGIYTTSKVYHARPTDYDPPSYFWSYYPSLEKINANCRVYEIPVIISYIIDQQKKHSWFASAGLSSVIMKRETYDYISKTSSGYETRSYTINNQNKHWMAEARLSFGYQQHFGNSSFTIEPYINAPLKGVGYGKVKLSGAGILFSVSIKPFAKK